MVRFTLILALISNWSYAFQPGDQFNILREPLHPDNQHLQPALNPWTVIEVGPTAMSATGSDGTLGIFQFSWGLPLELSNPFFGLPLDPVDPENPDNSGSQIVPRYYLIDGNDYFGGTADYIFKIDYKVTWDVTDTASTFSVQPQGVTVVDYQTQLDPIEYSVWLVKYKGNDIVNRYNGDIFYFSTVTYSTSAGLLSKFRVEPPKVTSETPNLDFSMEVTVVGNYAVIGTTPEYSPLYSTPVQGFVDHHLKFNVQESIYISL